MSPAELTPQWEVGRSCEFAAAIAFYDPLGLNPWNREQLGKGCSALRTARGRVAGGGESRVLHLCYAHFAIYHATPEP